MLAKFLNLFSSRDKVGAKSATDNTTGAAVTTDTGRRYRELLGEEKMNQQLLYERWAAKDTWHLRNEAMPLLYGIDPVGYKKGDGSPAEEAIQGLWTHARQCIEHGLLQVMNREQRPEDWRVEPLAIYQWAVVSRRQLPEPFVALMDFIGSTVKKTAPAPQARHAPDSGQISAAFDEDREKVLGMALKVLAHTPERCRTAGGEVAVELLLKVMKEQPRFKEYSGKLADGAILDLLNKYL